MRKAIVMASAALVLPLAGSAAFAGGGPLLPNHTVLHGTWAPPPGPNPTLLSDHTDLDFEIEHGHLKVHVHDHDGDLKFDSYEALLFVPKVAAWTRPAGSEWDFLGVPAGVELSLLPATQNPALLYLGWSTKHIARGVLTDDVLNVRLKGVGGGPDGSLPAPGVVSVFSFGDEGPIVRWTSSDGISLADTLQLLADSHRHYNIAFSAAGLYAVELEAFGTFADTGLPISEETTFYFGVAVVPEPTALGVLALAAPALMRRRR